MIGKTTIILNKATVLKAVEEYLNDKLEPRAQQKIDAAEMTNKATSTPYYYENFELKLEVTPVAEETAEVETPV